MRRVCIVCEGQTEESFVKQVLAPSFHGLGLNLLPEMIETPSGHKGGALRYERVKRHLRNTLRQRTAPVVTTFFDLYRLDAGFPAYELASEQRALPQRLEVLKSALHADIVADAKCAPDRFLPYIQPYEFEALLFSDLDTLTQLETSWASAMKSLREVRSSADSPEHINNHPDAKPASQLTRFLKNPKFRKVLHGTLAAQKIGIGKMEAECAFFAGWIRQLRELAGK